MIECTCYSDCPNEEVYHPTKHYQSTSQRECDKIIRLIKECKIELRDALSSEIVEVQFVAESLEYSFRVNNGDILSIANFRLVPMSGCNGICISLGSYVSEDYRNLGIGTILNKFRIKMAKHLGFSILMCTYSNDNLAQGRLLSKNNWNDIFSFINSKTGNKVNISTIIL